MSRPALRFRDLLLIGMVAGTVASVVSNVIQHPIDGPMPTVPNDIRDGDVRGLDITAQKPAPLPMCILAAPPVAAIIPAAQPAEPEPTSMLAPASPPVSELAPVTPAVGLETAPIAAVTVPRHKRRHWIKSVVERRYVPCNCVGDVVQMIHDEIERMR